MLWRRRDVIKRDQAHPVHCPLHSSNFDSDGDINKSGIWNLHLHLGLICSAQILQQPNLPTRASRLRLSRRSVDSWCRQRPSLILNPGGSQVTVVLRFDCLPSTINKNFNFCTCFLSSLSGPLPPPLHSYLPTGPLLALRLHPRRNPPSLARPLRVRATAVQSPRESSAVPAVALPHPRRRAATTSADVEAARARRRLQLARAGASTSLPLLCPALPSLPCVEWMLLPRAPVLPSVPAPPRHQSSQPPAEVVNHHRPSSPSSPYPHQQRQIQLLLQQQQQQQHLIATALPTWYLLCAHTCCACGSVQLGNASCSFLHASKPSSKWFGEGASTLRSSGAKHGPSQSFHVPPCICISCSSLPVPPETLCCPYPQGCRIPLAVASEPYFALVVLLVNLLLFQVWPDWGNARRPSYIIATDYRLPWTFTVLASLHKLTPSIPHCSF